MSDREKALEEALSSIIALTYSHIDGRDLLAEIHPRKTLDIVRRLDGVESRFEADWLSNIKAGIDRAKNLVDPASPSDGMAWAYGLSRPEQQA